MTVEQYDAIVIGAGQSGGPLSSALASNGLKTALIERSRVGGTCVNWGCTPSKTMIGSSRVAYLTRRSEDFGVNTDTVSVDMKTVRRRTNDLVDMFHEGSYDSLSSTDGLDLIKGEAGFTAEKTIAVSLEEGGTQQLTAEKFIINTGNETSIPPLDGIDDVPYLTSTSIMQLDKVPEHLIILGGGYIGLEFAQMFRRFGSDVSIIQRGEQLLGREDKDIAAEVLKILEEDGISVHLRTTLDRVTQSGTHIRGHAVGDDQEFDITGSHLLIATGRKPATDALDLENTGIEIEEGGFVSVNDRLETNVPGIWAIGDVKGGPAFTHISYNDYLILNENIFGNGGATVNDRVSSYVVFIDPELARVGLNEREAREAGYNIEVASMPMSSVARALETDETRGLMKAVIDADSDQILGAAIFGIRGGEVMSIIHLAMMTETPYTVLRDAPFAHPTVAESLNNLFAQVE